MRGQFDFYIRTMQDVANAVDQDIGKAAGASGQMCGRYRFTEEQNREILKIIEKVARKCGKGAWTLGEIRPTVIVPNRKRAEPKPDVI